MTARDKNRHSNYTVWGEEKEMVTVCVCVCVCGTEGSQYKGQEVGLYAWELSLDHHGASLVYSQLKLCACTLSVDFSVPVPIPACFPPFTSDGVLPPQRCSENSV